MKTAALIVLGAIGFWSCEGGSFKKKNCKSCETVTTGQNSQPTRITNDVCGDDEVAAHIVANTTSNSSVTVVTTCK
ncbi:hypothetical protein [Spirosoma endophyticum]|uniref:Uncharacterized protein n=1 Tax=Spirosoma endophyticum TaxID=662367 RepID=A0A1I1HXQ5_9BACT|nr:hypothetical protein [Spirosoma endophyticum]SFC26758.1 hypothetical protein SAMN05216167_101769 [Spirosoma endophyticum]